MARRSTLLLRLDRELDRSRQAAVEAHRAAERAVQDQRAAVEQGYPSVRREAAATEREWRKRYFEERQAEAAARSAIVDAEATELQSLLVSSLSVRIPVRFSTYRYALTAPPLNSGALGVPIPRPRWEDFAPRRPGALGKLFGGEERFQKRWAAAWNEYQQRLAQDTAAEALRIVQLEARVQEYAAHVAQAAKLVQEHNAEVDHFEQRFRAGDPDVVEGYFKELVLARSEYPD